MKTRTYFPLLAACVIAATGAAPVLAQESSLQIQQQQQLQTQTQTQQRLQLQEGDNFPGDITEQERARERERERVGEGAAGSAQDAVGRGEGSAGTKSDSMGRGQGMAPPASPRGQGSSSGMRGSPMVGSQRSEGSGKGGR